MQQEELKDCFSKESYMNIDNTASQLLPVYSNQSNTQLPESSVYVSELLFPSLPTLHGSGSNQEDSYGPPPVLQPSNCPIIHLGEASNEDPIPPESQQNYFQKLKNYRLSTYNMWNNTHQKYSHYLGPQFNTPLDTFTPRINKEMKVLARDLPCEDGGSIFVAFDDNRMDLIKALLMGPVDTPYAYGFYQFHISLPAKYPQVPPKVRITTTGEGKVRFNPNLYDDGYVCLSIINTWDGDPEEMWNPNHSNLFQVLLSIQSLVMDNRVIQKEPGYETYADNSIENKAYSQVVKYNNVKWAMLDMLQNPPAEFRKVVRLHFSLQKQKILNTISDWLKEDESAVLWNNSIDSLVTSHNNHTYSTFLTSTYTAELSALYHQLQVELNSLPTPEEIELEETYYQEPKDFPPSNFNYEDESEEDEDEDDMEVEVEDSESESSMSCYSKHSCSDDSSSNSEASFSSCDEEQKFIGKKVMPNKNTLPYAVAPASFSSLRFRTYDLINSHTYSFTPYLIDMCFKQPEPKLVFQTQTLMQALPCDPCRCIFVVMDQTVMNAMKALVAGREDSPYAYGLYLFDMICPENYPESPPILKIKTASGYARVSPNILQDGSVCLNISDLNHNSSLLEVLLNIQSSLLNTHAMEQVLKNTSEQDSSSILGYIHILRYNNLKYAILDQILNPPDEFREAIRYFFGYNKNKIYDMINIWVKDAEQEILDYSKLSSLIYCHNKLTLDLFHTSGYYTSLVSVAQQLMEELSKLPFPTVEDKETLKVEEYTEEMRVEMEEENPFMYLDVEPIYEQQNGLDMSYVGIEAIMSNSSQPVLLRSASSSDPTPPESTSKYYTVLNPLKINTLIIDTATNHKLASFIGSQDITPQKSARFSKELSVLSKHLPCEAEGSAFVIIDENRMDLMQALISGTIETPYAHGLYLFDIAFPSSYPQDPPKMNIRTTGNGAVRFNPNLYSDGYICLSIINTWGGNPEEMWNPSHSNLLQVLMSIQSLVMDDEVINKEPGYEAIAKTSDLNQSYCNIVKYNNLKYAMLDMIKHPPKGFEDVVLRHFSLKRHDITQTVENWLTESRDCTVDWGNLDYLVEEHNYTSCELFRAKGYSQSLQEVADELRGVLDKLPEF